MSSETGSTVADVALEVGCRLGEGPVWDDSTRRLLFVDILAGHVHTWAPGVGANVTDVGNHVGCVALTDLADHLVVALPDGLAVMGPDGSRVHFVPVDDDPSRRFNDGKVDSRGRLWVGTMGYRPTPGTAALYRWDGRTRPEVALSGVGLSNGIGWSPDESRLYHVDTLAQAVATYEFDPHAGTLGPLLRTLPLPDEWGVPDGLSVDVDGRLWVAFWGGSAVRCITPAGALEAIVEVPARQVTSCAFGGPQLDALYITSAWDGLSTAERRDDPLAGHLFVAHTGTAGTRAGRVTIRELLSDSRN